MSLSKTHSHKPWYSFTCVLLALVMMITPLVSNMAELHESEHLSASNAPLNTQSDHAIPDQDDGSDESSLHHLAHASHCCGHIVALLPTMQHLVLAPIQSTLHIKIEHSRIAFLRISHFRPPIFS